MTNTEIFERLQHIKIALAGRDNTKAGFRRIKNSFIDFIRAGKSDCRLYRVLMQTHFLVQWWIGPTDIQTTKRQFKISGQYDVQLMRINIDRCRRLNGFSNSFETNPATGEATHRPTEQAHVQNVLHTGRI